MNERGQKKKVLFSVGGGKERSAITQPKLFELVGNHPITVKGQKHAIVGGPLVKPRKKRG